MVCSILDVERQVDCGERGEEIWYHTSQSNVESFFWNVSQGECLNDCVLRYRQ